MFCSLHLIEIKLRFGPTLKKNKPNDIENNLLANKLIEIEQNLFCAFVFLVLQFSAIRRTFQCSHFYTLELSFWRSDLLRCIQLYYGKKSRQWQSLKHVMKSTTKKKQDSAHVWTSFSRLTFETRINYSCHFSYSYSWNFSIKCFEPSLPSNIMEGVEITIPLKHIYS